MLPGSAGFSGVLLGLPSTGLVACVESVVCVEPLLSAESMVRGLSVVCGLSVRAVSSSASGAGPAAAPDSGCCSAGNTPAAAPDSGCCSAGVAPVAGPGSLARSGLRSGVPVPGGSGVAVLVGAVDRAVSLAASDWSVDIG
ncbi:hypothetical protein Pen02_39740 [Plantactinospora endophytica]|uniref:Secreted protein n=1 Tax=Plantactinospora endophytica TaxID=673535 RepID=A0ABQ4E2V1_9ACTN|nr:hypothetical protein Pen02_39740 [Plantactinospora endophytica]